MQKTDNSSSDDGMGSQHSPCQKLTNANGSENPFTMQEEEEIMEWMKQCPPVYAPSFISSDGGVKVSLIPAQAEKMNCSFNMLDKWITNFCKCDTKH